MTRLVDSRETPRLLDSEFDRTQNPSYLVDRDQKRMNVWFLSAIVGVPYRSLLLFARKSLWLRCRLSLRNAIIVASIAVLTTAFSSLFTTRFVDDFDWRPFELLVQFAVILVRVLKMTENDRHESGIA